VAEQNRDVRRPPYATPEGVPITSVSRAFLASGQPAVIVPMIALGAIEGYLFLCGKTAERAHRADPDRATRLADELALILRGRRLSPSGDTLDPATLEAFLQDAPVPLLYADALGSIRAMSNGLAERLRAAGAAPGGGAGEELRLNEVIERLTGETS